MAISNYSRTTSFLIVIAAYILCLSAGYGSLMIGRHYLSPLWNMLVADIAATLVIWCLSIILRNASMYDAYWSVIPIAIVYYWIKEYSTEGWHYKNILLMAAVSYWGIRLTYNWARGWSGLGHQDWRYKMLEDKNPKLYWLTNLGGIHLFPTVVVYLCLIPVYFLVKYPDCNFILLIGFLISVLGTTIEFISDEQMRRFRKTAAKSEYIDWGLWKYSRHPNYFGEISFWAGLLIMSVGVVGFTFWWTVSGLAVITAMFLFVSIPMMEERSLKARPHYNEQIKRVSVLIPWFRKS
jgi:steroid 5-alpha reductase family enzyme